MPAASCVGSARSPGREVRRRSLRHHETLAGAQYSLERSLVTSKVVSRASALGMTMYLGFELSNAFNSATPLGQWFDDSTWSNVVLPAIQNLAAAARQLGFAGISFDQELYDLNGTGTATWNWDYPGNTHTEGQVRAEVRLRGQQVMRALVTGFPNIKITGLRHALSRHVGRPRIGLCQRNVRRLRKFSAD